MLTLRSSLLLLALLLLAFSPLFSQETSPNEMTSIEIIEELMMSLDYREEQLNQREQLLQQKQSALDERERSLTAIENLSKSLRDDSLKIQKSDYWRGFIAGAAVGFATGGGAGIYLGYKVSM